MTNAATSRGPGARRAGAAPAPDAQRCDAGAVRPPIASRRPLALLIAVSLYLAVTLSLYAGRHTFVHEEARRAIVAQEMLFRGDFLAPTVFERPYFKKPPFHNWLIAATALPGGIVSERGARAVSLAALLGLGIAVYALARRERPDLAPVAAMMTLTTYLAGCEYGNLAEPDMLLALLGVLAYLFYARGGAGDFVLSTVFMGLGILTKGVLPLFFYPGLLLRALLDRDAAARREIARLGLHLALALALPLAWAGALWARGDFGALMATGATEVAIKTTGTVRAFFAHLLTFPPKMALVLLPWSLVVACAFRRAPRPRGLVRDSFWMALVALAVFVFAPGSRDRYILPAVPFAAIVGAHHFDAARLAPRLVSRIGLGAIALACLVGGIAGAKLGYAPQAVVLCACAAAAVWLATRRLAWFDLALAAALLMVTGFEHGLYYYRAMHDREYGPLVAQISAAVPAGAPLVIDEHARMIHLGFYLEAGLGRPLIARGIAPAGPYYLVAPASRPDSTGRTLLTLAHPHRSVGAIVLQEVPGKDQREAAAREGSSSSGSGP